MSYPTVLVLTAAVWAAPHAPRWVGLCVGLAYTVFAITAQVYHP